MLLWYAAGAVFAVWNVFQTAGLDVRAVALGALAPVIVDVPFGAARYGHALLGPVALLVAVMLLTAGRGRRLARRRLIGVPIGWFCGLVLSGAFASTRTFWWPLLGARFEDAPLIPPLVVALTLELLGAVALAWCWTRFGLSDAARRRALWREGRVSTDWTGRAGR